MDQAMQHAYVSEPWVYIPVVCHVDIPCPDIHNMEGKANTTETIATNTTERQALNFSIWWPHISIRTLETFRPFAV